MKSGNRTVSFIASWVISSMSEAVPIKQLVVGDGHTCALTVEGVRCWGSNGYGQAKVPDDLKAWPDNTKGKDDESEK